jgi:hypothetical protein
MKRSVLTLLVATGAVALPIAAQALAAAPFTPPAVYHIASVRVTRTWHYAYSGTSNGTGYSSHGGESTTMTGSAVNTSTDPFGIYTARLHGTFRGRFHFDATGTHVSCPSYHLDPAAVQEQLQLNLIALSGGRVEVNAGVGPGQTPSGTAALTKEVEAVGTTCGRLPVNAGYALTYSPAPNNVHTPECSGIADGCAIVAASAFNTPRVTVHIAVSHFPIPDGFTVMPRGSTGHDTFSWSIAVVLERA